MAAIMVVEDERVVARDIQESLEQLGYDVLGTAASAEECLRYASARRPDLVLMDVRIDGDIDGIGAAKLLRDRYDIPVIFLTAYADQRTVSRARESEPLGYILKPFRAGELRAAVEMALFKHRAEVERRERERWFSTTLRAIGDAVLTVDVNGLVTFGNAAAGRLLDRSPDDLIGLPADDVLRLIDERTRQPLANPVSIALREQRTVSLSSHAALVHPRGERPVEDSVAPIVDATGKLLGAVIVFRDVSQQRRREEQEAISDRLASLGVLAAGVGHEVNNPLTYMLANASITRKDLTSVLESYGETGERQGEVPEEVLSVVADAEASLSEIEHGAERIARIVKDLKVFARPDAGQQSGDVIAALEWALRVTEHQMRSRARLVTSLSPVPHVQGTETKLGQVFLNLLINASQAIEEGHYDENTIFVGTSLDASGQVLVTVRDTGSGMSAEVSRRAFEPFFTTKPVGSGTGLGLSMCRRLVEGMGGQITVETSPGTGSTFRVLLPVSEAKSIVLMERTISDKLRGKILVVDDEAMITGAMRRMLTPAHDVTLAHSAEEAFNELERDQSYDLVLCDLMMPKATGMDLHRRVSEHFPEVAQRFVFLTGGAFLQSAADFLAAVPNAHLEKPLKASELSEFVEAFLITGR
jgi:PAS domain S-box-containing protein